MFLRNSVLAHPTYEEEADILRIEHVDDRVDES